MSLSKPREFWIDEFELMRSDKKPEGLNITGRTVHVREVVEIDWKTLFVDYCLQTESMDNFKLIQELVEKQLKKGE